MSMPVRVVIVDDSPTMRGLISATLQRDPMIKVVGMAGDPFEARAIIKQVSPDVITLDVEMPRMDGISFLEKLMRLRPMPVVMVSTLTSAGAEASLKALSLGAFDCVGKPTDKMSAGNLALLPEIVKAAANSKHKYQSRDGRASASAGPIRMQPNNNIIAIGSSTGGVEALGQVLANFPENCPPTVITQHMPPNFTLAFANRLNGVCAPTISEAKDGDILKQGHVYIAPGGDRHLTINGRNSMVCVLREGPLQSGHRPSVDVLFQSVKEACGSHSVGVILTGMGRDGSAGLKAMRDAGAKTIGQDEASCIVYGMPKVAFEKGAVERQLSLSQIGSAILGLCSRKNNQSAA